MNTTTPAKHPLDALYTSYERLIYDKNPLIEVVLQIQFPTLLRLQTELPSDFQGRILADYPHYEAQQAIDVKMQAPNVPPLLLESKVHMFLSADKIWRISLSSNSLSLSTKEYEDWDDFKGRAEGCLKKFFEIYPIKVVTRMGLRYRDLIKRSEIGKKEATWSELLNPLVLGPMGAVEFQTISAEGARWTQRFAFGDIKINFQGGTAMHDVEQCYMLELDVSIPKQVIGDLQTLSSELERLHEPVGPLFRWAIKNELHAALGPKRPTNRSPNPAGRSR